MDLASDDPSTLGRYRVQSRLGAGGMGRVLLGVDDTGRRVALKIVHTELAADPGFRERFRREVQMAASAPAWFTAPVLDADPDAERPWLATAYVEGPSLQSYVTTQGPLGEPGVAALAVRMADGLVALHAVGLVHRDLKPSNVLLADDGPRLIDFGISRAADTTSLTQTGHVMGTPEYMSPEQAGGSRDIGPASDMFAFGSLLVFAASGRSPFAADSAAASLYRISYAEPDLDPLTGRVREAVHACLTKDPAGRPTASQVRGLLRAADAEARADATAALPAPLSLSKGPAQDPSPTLVGVPAPSAPVPLDVVPTGAGWPAEMPPAGTYPVHDVPAYGSPPQARRRPWLIPVAVAVAVLLLAGVGLAAYLLVGNSRGNTVAAPPAPSATDAPSPAAGPSTDPTAGATIIDARTDGRFGTDLARFATPSRNIACQLSAESARCDVAQRSWQTPPKPADCAGDYGGGATLSGSGSGALTCAGDTVADPSLVVLDYGQGVRFDDVVCVSRETGLRCQNTATGHGFRVARASYDLF